MPHIAANYHQVGVLIFNYIVYSPNDRLSADYRFYLNIFVTSVFQLFHQLLKLSFYFLPLIFNIISAYQ